MISALVGPGTLEVLLVVVLVLEGALLVEELFVAELVTVVVDVVACPPLVRKYPPNADTAKAATTIRAATALETPTLERRTITACRDEFE